MGPFIPEVTDSNTNVRKISDEEFSILRDESYDKFSNYVVIGLASQEVEDAIKKNKKLGFTKLDMNLMMTEIALNFGWPKSRDIFRMINNIYGRRGDTIYGGILGMGELNTVHTDHFVGDTYVKEIIFKDTTAASIYNVTFEPNGRTNWHIHKATLGGGQILICTDGIGWYQEEGKEPEMLLEDDIVIIPANVKHWHGSAKDSWFTHIAIEVKGINTSTEWLEQVEESTYPDAYL